MTQERHKVARTQSLNQVHSSIIISPSEVCNSASSSPGTTTSRSMRAVSTDFTERLRKHPPIPLPWACDYCRVATFQTYQEACDHEGTCSRESPKWQNESSPVSTPLSASKSKTTTLLLVTPEDQNSLSDRQCFVREKFVEVFTASEDDVAVRHSRGAQKLHTGQVGIRCVYCLNLPSKKRAERATCYPSSISRIYQTVADMQRFHFEQCGSIPEDIKEVYRNLKTTRPRGLGSPQSYWITSARRLGLIDTDDGICYMTRKSSDDNHNYDGEQSMSLAPSSPILTASSRDDHSSPPSAMNTSRRYTDDGESPSPQERHPSTLMMNHSNHGSNNHESLNLTRTSEASMLLLLRQNTV